MKGKMRGNAKSHGDHRLRQPLKKRDYDPTSSRALWTKSRKENSQSDRNPEKILPRG